MPHVNKYKHLRLENPITALYRRRREQRDLIGNVDKLMRMCATKIAYATQQDAERASKVIKFHNRIYECPNCGKWHATSKDLRIPTIHE